MLSLCWAWGSPVFQQAQLWLCFPRASPAPQLDLGKKVSTPQDLMIEELSLRNNRGSRLFQQRQKRMQRFVFEHPSGYRQVGLQLIPPIPAGQPFPGACCLCREVGLGGLSRVARLGMEMGEHQVQHPRKSKGAGPPLHPLTPLLTCSSQEWVAHTMPRRVAQREQQMSGR